MKRHPRSVSATTLAQTLVCERQVVFDAKHGQIIGFARKAAIARGNRVHDLVYRRGHQPVGQGDRRCFIATAIYGQEAPETHLLRAFRDRVLMPRTLSRLLVKAYYRVPPPIAHWLECSPKSARAVRWILDRIVRWIVRRDAR